MLVVKGVRSKEIVGIPQISGMSSRFRASNGSQKGRNGRMKIDNL